MAHRIDVDRMTEEMPMHLFNEWRAYADLEPFDQGRQDMRFASVVWAIINMGRDTKKYRKPFPLGDFKLRTLDDEGGAPSGQRRQTWQEQKQIAMMHAALYTAEYEEHVKKHGELK